MQAKKLKIFVNIPELRTERLILRKITRRDLDDVYEYASDGEVSKYLLWEKHPEKYYTRSYLSLIESKYRKAEFYDWGIELDGKMIGTCGFSSISCENNSAEVGYVINRAYWGKGIALEALRAVLSFGYDVLGLNRIECRVMSENKGSIRVLEKCAMKFEGVLRQALLVKGVYRDISIYSMLKDEYIALKYDSDR